METEARQLSAIGIESINKVFIVAEIGLNHNGNITDAKKLISSAAACGVDAVKFQTYTTEKRVSADSSLVGILKQCELPKEAFAKLYDHAHNENVTFFSTPFDEECADYLNALGITIFKIASFDITNRKLIKHIAQFKNTILLSTGMATLVEIEEAYTIITGLGAPVALLHCISAYPLQEIDANLGVIGTLKEHFNTVVGFSDHTSDIVLPLYAVAMGARIIEKHFMIDGTNDCVDKDVSITQEQMKILVNKIRHLEQILGSGIPGMTQAQAPVSGFRRYS
jgi:N,N'-diacetyllegionaminate synthase